MTPNEKDTEIYIQPLKKNVYYEIRGFWIDFALLKHFHTKLKFTSLS